MAQNQSPVLRLELPLRVFEDLSPNFEDDLQRQLSDWRDGRYPFDVEMIREGVLRIVRNIGVTAVLVDEVKVCLVTVPPTT